MASIIPTGSAKPDHPVLDICTFLAKAQVWPHTNVIDPRRWLTNFKPGPELTVAHELLNGFMYFPDRMARELLRSAVQKIIPHLIDFKAPPREAAAIWRETVNNLIVLHVTGETPNPADSGLGYVRVFRDLFNFPERRIHISHRQVLSDLNAPSIGPRPTIIFVDDFVGSGRQFTTLWRRSEQFQFGMELSFADVAASGARFFYCPLLATTYGLDVIKKVCGDAVVVSPAYELTDDYNALHASSRIWMTSETRRIAPGVLASIADRVGMPDTNGKDTDDWRGFHKLGLGLAIRDTIPDACLGVFHFDKNGWKPLFNKAG